MGNFMCLTRHVRDFNVIKNHTGSRVDRANLNTSGGLQRTETAHGRVGYTAAIDPE